MLLHQNPYIVYKKYVVVSSWTVITFTWHWLLLASTLIGSRVISCYLSLFNCVFVSGYRLCWCFLLTNGFQIFHSYFCVFSVFPIFSYVLKNLGVFGHMITRDNDFELLMPYYCLIIAHENEFYLSMHSYCPLQWLLIFSAHVRFLDALCDLYYDLGIVSSH